MHAAVYFRIALVSFLVGVAIASFIVAPGWAFWLLMGLGASCLLWTRRPRIVIIGIVLLGCAMGVHRYASIRADDTPLNALAVRKASVTITGYMDGGLKHGASSWSFYVWAKSVDGRAIDERLLVRVPREPSWRYGDGVSLTGKLGRVSAFDDFDYPAYLRKEGVRATTINPSVQSAALSLGAFERGKVRFVRGILNIRDIFERSVRQAVAEPAASYLVGILVGGRAELPQPIIDDFSRTSTSHVLAISGYNITILAVAIMRVLSVRLGRRWAMVASLVVIAVFVVMTGASASVVRAAIMGALMLAAGALGRQADIGGVIMLSAAVMAWFNPLILRDDVGFQLSFVALCGLVYLEPLITARLGSLGKHWIVRIIATTTAAQIAVLPLILYYFHTLSVIGPLANVLVLPLVPLAMALGFTTGLIGLVIPFLGHVVGLLAWVVASYHLWVVHAMASIPWSAFELHINGQIVVAWYGIMIIWWHLDHREVTQPDESFLLNGSTV